MRWCELGLLACAVALNSGCSDEPSGGDTSLSGGGDTSGADGASDGGPAGTSGADDGPTDGGPSDSGPSDSGPSDSGPSDSGTDGTDTGGADAGETGCDPICLDVPVEDVGDGPACGESNYVVTPNASNVLLVLDASGSMVNNALFWDHDDMPGTAPISRWHSLHNSVESIIGTFDNAIDLGMLLFPTPNGMGSCAIADPPEVAVQPMAGSMILSAMPPKLAYDELWGNPTPTEDAINIAVSHMETLDPAIPGAMILISDGVVSEPCFNYYDETLTAIENAYQDLGIPTYVVGVNISAGNRDGYNGWADAGGVPTMNGNETFYNVRNELELSAALQQISGFVISCTAPLAPAPPDPLMVQVQLDGNIVLPAANCQTDDGWVYTNPAGPYDSIELCGSYCDQLKAAGGEVLALYGCPPEG